MKARLRRLASRIRGRFAGRSQRDLSPIERLVNLIFLKAKKHGVRQIVVEYRPDGDAASWPAGRLPPLDAEARAKIDAELDEPAEDFADDQAMNRGVCGVLYSADGSDSWCEMQPPALLWSAIRDQILVMAGIDPERCSSYRNGYRYHGHARELIEGDFHIVSNDGRLLEAYAVRYEVDFDAERVVIAIKRGPEAPR